MLFRRYTSLLVSTALFVQSVSPAFATHVHSVDEIEAHISTLRKFSSTPAPLDFESQPGKTAAGVLHWAKKADDAYVLLGKRNDDKGWCNLGGESGATDFTPDQGTIQGLTNTAEREIREKSNGLYAHHPRLLRKQPFIGLYSPDEKDGLLHYIYWQQVQYLEPNLFNKKSIAATETHSKEYTDFMWVKASLLHHAVETQTPLLDVEGQSIDIFEPLFTSLSTASGKTFLNELSTHQTIRRFNRDVRPLVNRLYIEKNQDAVDVVPGNKIAVHWELPKIHGTPTADKAVAVPFGKNAFGKFYTKRQVIGPDNEILADETVFFDAKKEEDVFAEAVAAHGMAMVELKRKGQVDSQPQEDNSFSKDELKEALGTNYKTPDDFTEPKVKREYPAKTPELRADLANTIAMIKLKRETNPSLKTDNRDPNTISTTPHVSQWNPNCEETLSRIHLRILLGKDCKTPDNFPDSDNPRRAADLANLQAYFSIYKDDATMYRQEGKTLKSDLKLLDSDYEFFADILGWEEEHKQWPTFYHGASAKQNNVNKSYTYVRELTEMRPFDGLVVLRGTDLYFKKDDRTIWDMLKRTGAYENTETSRAMLFLNFVLLAGLVTSKSTTSAPQYVLNNQSASEQNILKHFHEAMILAGFSKPEYAYFQSLFEQHIAHKNPTAENSVMLAISQNPKDLDKYNYPTINGYYYDSGNGEGEQKSTLEMCTAIQEEFERQKKDGFEPFSEDTETKKALFPENRLSLHPDCRVMDPSQAQMKAFDRFPLTEQESQLHDLEMRQTTIATLADWLVQKTRPVDGSFIKEPTLKKLYKYAYRGLTHEDLEEKPSVDGFMYLIQAGYLEAAGQYLENYPEILKLIDQETLANLVLESNNVGKVIETVFNDDLTLCFKENDPLLFTRLVREDHFDLAREYLQHFPETLKLMPQESLANLVLESKAVSFIDEIIKEHFDNDLSKFLAMNQLNEPLKLAVKAKHEGLVRRILRIEGYDPSTQDANSAGDILISAVKHGTLEILIALLRSEKFDTTYKTSSGETALTKSIIYGRKDMFKRLLVCKNIDVNLPTSVKIETRGLGLFPLTWASNNYPETVPTILKHPTFNPNAQSDTGGFNEEGYNLLINVMLLEQGRSDTLNRLLALPKIDVNAMNKGGKTILSQMIHWYSGFLNSAYEHCKIPDLLNKEVAGILEKFNILLNDTRLDINAPNKDGDSPLHVAVKSQAPDLVRTLLEKEANRDAQDSMGSTPLDLATDPAIADLLSQIHQQASSESEK